VAVNLCSQRNLILASFAFFGAIGLCTWYLYQALLSGDLEKTSNPEAWDKTTPKGFPNPLAGVVVPFWYGIEAHIG
jgi:hypothetical protein